MILKVVFNDILGFEPRAEWVLKRVGFELRLCWSRAWQWLEHQAHDQHGLSSKPIGAILLCPWERHFMAHSPAW